MSDQMKRILSCFIIAMYSKLVTVDADKAVSVVFVITLFTEDNVLICNKYVYRMLHFSYVIT